MSISEFHLTGGIVFMVPITLMFVILLGIAAFVVLSQPKRKLSETTGWNPSNKSAGLRPGWVPGHADRFVSGLRCSRSCQGRHSISRHLRRNESSAHHCIVWSLYTVSPCFCTSSSNQVALVQKLLNSEQIRKTWPATGVHVLLLAAIWTGFSILLGLLGAFDLMRLAGRKH